MRLTLCLLAAVLPLAAQVSFDRLRQADSEPGNWLTYSGNYSAQRYSRLDQINAANVRHLRPVWVYQMLTTERVETSPVVADGIMYVSEPGGSVTAGLAFVGVLASLVPARRAASLEPVQALRTE